MLIVKIRRKFYGEVDQVAELNVVTSSIHTATKLYRRNWNIFVQIDNIDWKQLLQVKRNPKVHGFLVIEPGSLRFCGVTFFIQTLIQAI